MNIEQAAATGDRRTTLVALRDYLANALANTESGRDQASLSKRLMEVMDEIDGLPNPDEKSAVDDLVQEAQT